MTILFIISCLHNDYSVVITCVATKNIITITEKQQPQQKAFKVQGQSTVLALVEKKLAVMVAVAVLQVLYVIVARLN